MPVFVHGQKERVSLRGFGATYCPICRDVSPFVIHQIGVVAHVYWIPIATVRPVSCIGLCMACGTATIVEPDMFGALAESFDGDMNILIASTNPEAHADYDRHCQELDAARNHAIPPAERIRLISEPFQLLAPLVDDLYARRLKREKIRWGEALMVLSPIHVIETGPSTGSLCPSATIALLITIAAPIALLVIGKVMAGNAPSHWWSYTSAILSVPTGIFIIATLQARYRRRVLAKRIIPLLAQSLHPLRPNIAELRQVLDTCADAGLHIGAAIKADLLIEAIERFGEYERRGGV